MTFSCRLYNYIWLYIANILLILLQEVYPLIIAILDQVRRSACFIKPELEELFNWLLERKLIWYITIIILTCVAIIITIYEYISNYITGNPQYIDYWKERAGAITNKKVWPVKNRRTDCLEGNWFGMLVYTYFCCLYNYNLCIAGSAPFPNWNFFTKRKGKSNSVQTEKKAWLVITEELCLEGNWFGML